MEQQATKLNTFTIVGELVENNLEVKTSSRDGKDYISGKIIIKSMIDGRPQLTEVELYANKFKQDGGSSKFFETYSNLNASLNKRIKVTGELSENRFFSTQSGQVISTTVNRGRFISAATTKDTDTATFTFAGYVVKSLYERNTKDGNLLSYEIIIAQSDYKDAKPICIKFSVDKDNTGAVNVIQQLYDKGLTVKVGGNISVVTEDVEVEETTAFGNSVKTYHNTYKSYVITTGSQPIVDTGAYAPQDVIRLTKSYADDGLAIERAAKARAEGGQAPKASTQPARNIRSSLL